MRTGKNNIIYILPLLVLFSFPLFSQTIVNDYNEVTAIGGSTATVTSLTGINGIHTLAVGDTVLIIQMQGAVINESNSASFGSPTINNAGNYEINVICGVSGNQIGFKYTLVHSYTPVTGAVQIVTHGDGKAVNVSIPAMTGTAWNGTTGGVAFVKASGTVTLTGNIDMTGKGFRGGGPGGVTWKNLASSPIFIDPEVPNTSWTIPTQFKCGDYIAYTGPPTWWGYNVTCAQGDAGDQTAFYLPKVGTTPAPSYATGAGPAIFPEQSEGQGSPKGEGISAFIPAKENGRGAQANGGGGGNAHNSGGAGGANAGSGGAGGKQYEGNNSALGVGGVGGYALPTSLTKVFMGGGGGGGHANQANGNSSGGANGGGVIIISANSLIAGGFSIKANGDNNIPKLDKDAEGGGGAGGAIVLEVSSISGSLITSAKGGNGGNSDNLDGTCIGPGGGGGGGYSLSRSALPSAAILTGGIAGTVQNVTGAAKPCFGAGGKYGAADGAVGTASVQPAFKISRGSVVVACTLPIEIASFFTIAYSDKVFLSWITASEINNNYFAIERSKDGINFEEIGTVLSFGSSNQNVNYSFWDKHPYNGVSYYRLKQLDFDGQYSYSALRSVDLNSAYGIIGIFPQPLINEKNLHIHYSLPRNSTTTFRIADALGKEVFCSSVHAIQGINQVSLPLLHVPDGIYYLIFQSEEILQCRKIIME